MEIKRSSEESAMEGMGESTASARENMKGNGSSFRRKELGSSVEQHADGCSYLYTIYSFPNTFLEVFSP